MNTGSENAANSGPNTASSPPQSRIFGKFRLLANLGSGGMGEVFLALSRSSLGGVSKLIVIKRLRHFAEDEARSEARQMFLNEARLATLLNHPNIVQTNDAGIEAGHMYITMEYLEGQPLNSIIRQTKAKGTRLDDAIALKIISDALAGLHYAHELRGYDGQPLCIVHRDLSPHNLFVTYEGVTKVVDFGIAKTAGSAKTEDGIIKGKFAYMAPEQTQAEDKIDRRADVFVMGIVLWELLTGELLVHRKNEFLTISRLLNEEFTKPSSVRSQVTPDLDNVVMKALAKNPDDRFQTAQEMREAIEEYLVARSRPVRPEEIGPVVSELFRDERSIMQERIRKCIATATDDASMDNLPALGSTTVDSTQLPTHSWPPDLTPSKRSARSATRDAAALRGADAASRTSGSAAQSNRGTITIIAVMVGAVIIGLGLYSVFARHPAPVPEGAHTAVAATTAPPASALPAPTATASEAPILAPAASATASASEPSAPKTSASHAAASHKAPPPPRATTTAPAGAPPAPTPAATPTSRGRVFNTSL